MMLQPEEISRSVSMEEIYRRVSEIASPVYLVGGSVRDLLLGQQPKDYDFATPLDPDTVEGLVKAAGRRAYAIGKKYGTIGFKIDGDFIEITTFRTERYAPRLRKPSVTFVTDIQSDLSRRDFTMNAIAAAYLNGEMKLVDPYGGQSDIENRVIRAVGVPTDRLREDPLRMLRAIRFISQLGFSIEESLGAAIKESAHLIYDVSHERWAVELDKILIGEHYERALEALVQTGLLTLLLPELLPQVEHEKWQQTTAAIDSATDIESRWAALLGHIGQAYTVNPAAAGPLGGEIALNIAERLRWSKARRDAVYGAVVSSN